MSKYGREQKNQISGMYETVTVPIHKLGNSQQSGGGGSFVLPHIFSSVLVLKYAIKDVVSKTLHYLNFNIVQVYRFF